MKIHCSLLVFQDASRGHGFDGGRGGFANRGRFFASPASYGHRDDGNFSVVFQYLFHFLEIGIIVKSSIFMPCIVEILFENHTYCI